MYFVSLTFINIVLSILYLDTFFFDVFCILYLFIYLLYYCCFNMIDNNDDTIFLKLTKKKKKSINYENIFIF